MSTRLALLGILRERPLHGYEIKRTIEERMGDWTDIKFGSIYFALGTLERDGAIRRLGTEREGKRPSREIYEITAEGQALSHLRTHRAEIDRDQSIPEYATLVLDHQITHLIAEIDWMRRLDVGFMNDLVAALDCFS